MIGGRKNMPCKGHSKWYWINKNKKKKRKRR